MIATSLTHFSGQNTACISWEVALQVSIGLGNTMPLPSRVTTPSVLNVLTQFLQIYNEGS